MQWRETIYSITLIVIYTGKDTCASVRPGNSAFDRPSMKKLQRLVTDAENPINIIEESACKFKEIGTILLNSTKVDNIEASVRGNQVEAVREIYKQWMREDENYSWTKLTQCLRQCELKVLASQIERHFGLPSPEGIYFLYTSHSAQLSLYCHSVM